jgi:hypothetical protein
MSLGGVRGVIVGLEPARLELKQIRAVNAPGVTHIKYEVG